MSLKGELKASKEGANKLIIEVDQDLCRGCCLCVLMCSFHHTGVFSRELSSIDVSVSSITGEVKWEVGESCDMCKKEAGHLCVKYCPYDCLAVKEVK